MTRFLGRPLILSLSKDEGHDPYTEFMDGS
jgi:hypothetical protein